MSATLVNKKVYRCVCELPDCRGKGRPWYSKDKTIPKRCTWCGRYTWNPDRIDKRVPKNARPDSIREYNRQKQAEFRARLRGKKGQ